MNEGFEVDFAADRPRGFTGRGDKYLGDIIQELRRVLRKAQKEFVFDSCRLPDGTWIEVAALLVEWAEDIHNNIGLWRTVETHQQKCFGTPLPLIVGASPPVELRGFDPRRIQFLLAGVWPWLNPERVISPGHTDLKRLAETASRLLTERFARLPQDSGVKRFLAGANEHGWDVKRKLVWMGSHSYLFRWPFIQYLKAREGDPDIQVQDDFICQRCTEWSGLGVIDVLAGTLDLPAEDRATLLTWHERHFSYFRALTRNEDETEVKFITVRNVVNGRPYTIRMNMPDCPFVPGMVVWGALTPWRGEWYWSGGQAPVGKVSEADEAGLRKEMLERFSATAYCYCPEEAAQALAMTRKIHAEFVAHYGSDCVMFPDGLTLAAAEQKHMEAQWRAMDQEKVARLMRERGLEQAGPKRNFPPEFLQHEQGIGVFSNPDEGVEYVIRFNAILSGLRRRGTGLTDEERDVLYALVADPAISPAFVRRLVAEHGAESLAETFLARDPDTGLVIEYLLRKYKGQFYRRRYPSLSLV